MSNGITSNTPRKNLGNIMLLLAAISLLSKALGFARDIVLTYHYGAGVVADAYLTTLSIPDMILDLLAHTTMIGFVPLAVEKMNRSEHELNRFATSSLKVLLIASLLFSLVLTVFPNIVISLLAPGFEGEGYALALRFLRVLSFTIVFRTVTNVAQAFLSTKKYFVPGAFLGILLDVSVIAAIMLSKRLDIVYLLPVGALAGTLLQMLFSIPFSVKQGFRFLLKDSIMWQEMKMLIAMSIPAALSVGLMQISTLFNRALASETIAGGITMLNNASRISYFVENIIVSSIVTVLYPLLSEYYIKHEKALLKDTLSDAVERIITFLLPATVGLAMLSYPIIDTLYGHGAFTQENVKVTAELMCYYVIGIVGIGVQTVFTRALFAMKRIKTSIIVSLSLLAIYLGVSFALSRLFGLRGIAFATGLSYTVGGIVYYAVINKVCHGIHNKSVALVMLKSGVASGVMALCIYVIGTFTAIPDLIRMVLSVAVGFCVYAALAMALGLKYLNIKTLIRSVIKKVKR